MKWQHLVIEHPPIEEMSQEDLLRALEDPMWRICHLYKIMTKAGDGEDKVSVFKPNDAQVELLTKLHYRNIVLKARQRGITTLAAILYLDTALFRSDIRAGIIADTESNAKTIFRDKVLFAYNNLPDMIRNARPTIKKAADELLFSNNSSIRVSTSMRSGTIDYLHISEFGKICARFPDRAVEVVSGSLPSVPNSGVVIIESTAEGQEGYFYEFAKEAQAMRDSGKKLGIKDAKFFFFPWWSAKEYRLDPSTVVIGEKDHLYFNSVELLISQKLDMEQRAWYVATRDKEFGGDYALMWREYPSTPEESFQQAIEGAYYVDQLSLARKQQRITQVPYETGIPVNTFWDIGLNDEMAIWFHQRIGSQDRFIRYYEASGESFEHFVNYMQGLGYVWGKHYLPHDGDTKRLGTVRNWTPKQMLEDLGLRDIVIVERIDRIQTGINMTRQKLSGAWFNEEGCKIGIKHLTEYRKEWNARLGAWKDTPLHNKASNAADAIRQWAQGYEVEVVQDIRPRKTNWRTI